MDEYESARERKLRKRKGRMPVHGQGVLTLDDLLTRGKWGKPARGGKREIVVEDENESKYERE